MDGGYEWMFYGMIVGAMSMTVISVVRPLYWGLGAGLAG